MSGVTGERDTVSRPRLENFWHPIAAIQQVTEQPQRFVLLDEELAVFRDDDGVHAFKDVCIHRGTALSLGTVHDGRLTCAYHGWQYDPTGKCVHIPALPAGQAVPSKARAITYPACESAGLVWVSLDDPVRPVPSPPNGVWHDPAYHTFVMSQVHWQASASRAVENFMDFSHFPFVHTGLLGDPSHAEITTKETGPIEPWERGFKYWFDTVEPAESAYPGRKRFLYYLETPFSVHIERRLPEGMAVMVSLVASPTREAEAELFVLHARNGDFDVPDATYAEFSDEILEQDRRIVESQRPHKIPLDLREEMHIKVPDAHAVAYRRELQNLEAGFAFLP